MCIFFFTFCMLSLFKMLVDHACIDSGLLSSTISFVFGIHNWLRHCFDYFYSDDIDKLGKVQSSFWKEWKLKLEEQKHLTEHSRALEKIIPGVETERFLSRDSIYIENVIISLIESVKLEKKHILKDILKLADTYDLNCTEVWEFARMHWNINLKKMYCLQRSYLSFSSLAHWWCCESYILGCASLLVNSVSSSINFQYKVGVNLYFCPSVVSLEGVLNHKSCFHLIFNCLSI